MHTDFFGVEENKKTIEFIKKNWVVIATMPDGFYHNCNLLGADNKCTDYENRLPICSDFPFYERNRVAVKEITKLMTVGCGFITN